jgi:hypothetical protein
MRGDVLGHNLGKVGLGVRVAQLQVLSRGLVQLGHDMQNHLATINESAGLMIDLLQLKRKKRFDWAARFFKRGQGPGLDREPFLNDLGAIQKEVIEGATLTRRLSRFAHRLGETQSVFRGDEALEEIQDILWRQAEERGVRLEMRLAETASMMETDRMGFQVAVLWNVEEVMRPLESGDRVVLETDIGGRLFQVRIIGPHAEHLSPLSPDEPGSRNFCRDIVKDLGGHVSDHSGDGTHVVTLAFPLAKGTT